MMFIIIVILGYLLSYRLTSYLAEFKLEKNYSRIDIAFLAVCALLMYLPMSHISDEPRSETEFRYLAVWKPLINKKGEINYKFGRDYDNWFNDRFNFRKYCINLSSFFLYRINRNFVFANHFLNKSTGEMYELIDTGRKTIPEHKIQGAIRGLKALKTFCDENKITPYIILLPRKMDVYKKEALPFNSHNQELEDKILVERLEKETGVKIMYMYDVIEAHKYDERVFYKTDPHVTDYATMLYYNEWLDEVGKSFKGFKRVSTEDFDIDRENRFVKLSMFYPASNGNIYRMLSLPSKKADKILKDKYPLYLHKNMKSVELKRYSIKNDFQVFVFDTKHPERNNIFITGTSNTPIFVKFAPFSFGKSTCIKMYSGRPDTYNLSLYKELINDSKAQIFVGIYTITNVEDFRGFGK